MNTSASICNNAGLLTPEAKKLIQVSLEMHKAHAAYMATLPRTTDAINSLTLEVNERAGTLWYYLGGLSTVELEAIRVAME